MPVGFWRPAGASSLPARAACCSTASSARSVRFVRPACSPTAVATLLAIPCGKDRSYRVNPPSSSLPTSSTPNAVRLSPRMGTLTIRCIPCPTSASGARMRSISSSWRDWMSWPVSQASPAVVSRSAATRVRPTMPAGQPMPACSTKASSSTRYCSTLANLAPTPPAAAPHASQTTASRSSSRCAAASKCPISPACRKVRGFASLLAASAESVELIWCIAEQAFLKRPGCASARRAASNKPAERDAQRKTVVPGGTTKFREETSSRSYPEGSRTPATSATILTVNGERPPG